MAHALLVRLRADRRFSADPPPGRAIAARGAAATTWGHVLLRRPPTRAGPDGRARGVRRRPRADLGQTPPQAAGAPRPRPPHDPAARARHGRAGRGPPPVGAVPPAVGALALMSQAGRPRPGYPLEGRRPALRPGAHAALLQADPRLDDAQVPPPAAGQPRDLANRGGLHPAALGP